MNAAFTRDDGPYSVVDTWRGDDVVCIARRP